MKKWGERPADGPRCENCRFAFDHATEWLRKERGYPDDWRDLYCHRFPPQLADYSRYVSVHERAWCGEWQPESSD
jgi:hypothetical protein